MVGHFEIYGLIFRKISWHRPLDIFLSKFGSIRIPRWLVILLAWFYVIVVLSLSPSFCAFFFNFFLLSYIVNVYWFTHFCKCRLIGMLYGQPKNKEKQVFRFWNLLINILISWFLANTNYKWFSSSYIFFTILSAELSIWITKTITGKV